MGCKSQIEGDIQVAQVFFMTNSTRLTPALGHGRNRYVKHS